MNTNKVARTDEEIIARIAEVKDRDFFGFEQNDLLICLSYSAAVSCLPSVADDAPEDWEQESREVADVIDRMLTYMPFAWDKANNRRGLSAGRSMSHYSAWLWLAGDNEGPLANILEYEFYGKDKLALICDHYGWDYSQWDDGIRTN